MASNNPSCLQWLGSGEVCTHTRSDPEGKFCPGCGVKFSDKQAVGESRCPSLNDEGVRCGSNLRRDDYKDGDCCEECGEDIPLEVWKQVPDWSIPVDPAKHPRSHICHQILTDGTICSTQSNPEKSPKHCKNGNCKIPFAVRVEVPEIKCPFGQEGAVCGRTLQKPADNRPFFCASCGSFIPTDIWYQVDRKENKPISGPTDPEQHPRHLMCHQILSNGGLCGYQAKADAAKFPNFCKRCKTKTAEKALVESIRCPFYKKPLDQTCGQNLKRGSLSPKNSTCPSCKAFIPKEIWHQAKVPMTAVIPDSRGNVTSQSLLAPIHILVLAKKANDLDTLLSEKKADVYERTGLLDKSQLLFQRLPGDNPSKFQALHLACLTGHLESGQILINHGAEVNSVTGEGLTPLYLAILSGSLDTIKLLLSHGADTKHTFVNNYNYIHHAIEVGVKEDLLRLLLGKNFQGDINGLTTAGVSPCHMASRLGHTSLLRTLIDHEADTRVRDRQGRQPLHIAIENGHQDIITTLIRNKLADIDATTSDGRTGLMIACESGFEAIVAQLIESNASIHSKDSAGRSALTITKETQNESMLLVLQRRTQRTSYRIQKSPATRDRAIDQIQLIPAGTNTDVRRQTTIQDVNRPARNYQHQPIPHVPQMLSATINQQQQGLTYCQHNINQDSKCKKNEHQQPLSVDGIHAYSNKEEGHRHLFREDNYQGIAEQPNQPFPIAETNRQQSLKQFLEVSGLTNYFPSKLGIQDVMKITDETSKSGTQQMLLFYQRLITLDSSCRDKFEGKPAKVPEIRSSPSSALDLLSRIGTASSKTIESKNHGVQIHPLDFFLLAFLCGDQSLRDTFIKKACLCRLALPVYYPTFQNGALQLLLGPLRSIILEWKPKPTSVVASGSQSETKSYETDAVTAPCHFVVFSRVSRSERYRKSKILNDILCETLHPTFFHWDCPNGTRERLLTNGLVEGSWYIPSGRDSDLFSSLIMFLNLRGNVLDHQQQYQAICRAASVVVQLLSVSDFTNKTVLSEIAILLNQEIPVVLLIHDDTSNSTESYNQHLQQALMHLQNICKKKSMSHLTILPTTENGNLKNADKIKLELRQEICKFTLSLPTKSYECLIDNGMNNDESTSMNQMGKQLSEETLMPIKRKQGSDEKYLNIQDIKAQLPLQGDLWKKWSSTQKKINRPFTSTGHSSVAAINNLEKQMNEIRQKQFALCLNPSPLMRSFIEGLSYGEPKHDTTMNYLRWMAYFLDDNSRNTLPNYHNTYNRLWLELRSFKEKQDKENKKKVKDLQTKVKEAEVEFANASFGLEHLMREIGQMYEAVVEGAKEYSASSQYIEKVKKLPRRMAELIYAGQPIELMDGDATNIPLSWIKAVFKELHKLLGAKSVFVISVLGIQSSGKSTLLNTMFGLQFAVSAGRCTKGVYTQLVHVDKNGGLPFDYVCVVDTEGLRAAELGMTNFDRDNELATFVIGLGDLTIINIKGESYSEMKDVLQIVVHAFLRIKLVIEHRHQCIFIHQNVGAANAQEKMQFGCQKLQENLDEMTIEAAAQENRKDVRTFNDVIEFDCLSDVYFFPDLWHGDPPMAHANPGYHEQIASIKQKIFISKQSQEHRYWSFEEISSKISDLWAAILADDFVFAFRNSLEVKAYNTLEHKYRALMIQAEKKFVEWKEKTADKAIKNCQKETEINCCQLDLENKITLLAEGIKTDLENDFVEYIKGDTNVDLMVKWQESKILSLKHEVDSRVAYYKSIVGETLDDQLVRLLQNMKTSPLISELSNEACGLAERLRGLKGTSANIDLKVEFDKLWKSRTSNLNRRAESAVKSDTRIERQIEKQLFSYITSQQRKNLTEALKKKNIACGLNTNDPIMPPITLDQFNVSSSEDAPWYNKAGNTIKQVVRYNTTKALTFAQELLAKNLKKAYDVIIHLPKSAKFSTQQVNILIDKILEPRWDTTSFPFEKTTVITFESDIVPYIAVHVCRYAYPFFCKMHAQYESTEGYVTQLNKYQETLWNLFNNVYNKVNAELICADLVRDQLKSIIKRITQDAIPTKIQLEVFQMYATKQCLIREILLYLGKLEFPKESKLIEKKKIFSEYLRYFRSPRVYAGQWLAKRAKKFITEESKDGNTKLGTIARALIGSMYNDILQRLHHVTQCTKDELSLQHWIDRFCELQTDNLHIISADFNMESSQNNKVLVVADFDKHVRERVSALKDFLAKQCLTASPEDLGCGSTVYENATDQLWGCPENCPFCKEPCLDSSVDHEKSYPHKCMKHRPSGLNGTGDKHSNILSLTNCNHDVAGKLLYSFNGKDKPFEPYKDYKKFFPHWDIDPNPSSTTSVPYWCWVYASFVDNIAEHYNRAKPEVPSEWKKITKVQAIESLQSAYTIQE